MGFELNLVVSDAKHHGPFICDVCKSLASQQDVLITPCNHPFCRPCLEVWMSKRISEGLNCRCPACREDLEMPEATAGATVAIEGKHVRASPLEMAQPLAFTLLNNVQVKCTEPSCYWVGDYGQAKKHLVEHNLTTVHTPSASAQGTTPPVNGAPQPQYTYDDPSRAQVSTRGEATGAHHGRTLPLHAQQATQVDQSDLRRAMERCDKLKKQANAKFNRGDVEGARLLYSEGLALVSSFPLENNEVRVMTASLYSNRAVTFFRERILPPSVEDCDRSLELDPKSEKTYIRKWRALSAMGQNDASIQCLKDGLKALPQSMKLSDELRKATGPPQTPGANSVMDMSYSIASVSRFDEQSRAHYEMELSVAGDPNPALMERAERLKKQANAKFNKGDIEAARNLYADAIGCIPQNHQQFSQGVRGLLSMLYSNRAVTYFREKNYEASLEDCEKAIELDTKSEKSYIRKARALVAMDMHDEARKCLEAAVVKLPTSKKIKEELSKAIEESRPDSGKGDAMTTADSVDFGGSVASFNFYITPDASKATGAKATGGEDYAEELELADKLKRNANAKFNRGDIAGARLLYTEALACLPNDRENEEVRACLASLYANRAVTFFREKEYGPSTWDCDKAIELDPASEKSYIRKARAFSAMEKHEDAVVCIEEGLKAIGGSSRLQEELEKSKEALAESRKDGGSGAISNANDFQVSYSSFETNSNFFVSPSAAKLALGSVDEGKTQEFALPQNADEDLERAEKLKKQANAKLNKGDVAGARVLYGEGLACLPAKGPATPEGRELAASLYANRAVTFFREKKFSATVLDCDKSLELDPKHEKSYIRKWRALMALGNFEDAYKCLETAVNELPNSDRLNEELESATEQRELLTTVNTLLDNREYQEARDTLKPLVKTSDNVSLWLAAARADACLGFTDSALERVNKVLLFNPKHAEGLQVRGYAMFLSGEMEHGINLLKEALEADIENENQDVSTQLEECERCFTNFSKGQARVKRGRYQEAVELFSSAVEEGQEIPPDAPLYGLLLTERAEASLLSNHYEEALEDCIEAIRLKNDNMTAWTVKVEVYFALGRLQEARDELADVRKTWGAGNETIEEAYKKTDFELRLKKADDDLHRIMLSVESGTPPEVRDGEPLHMNRDGLGTKRSSRQNLEKPSPKTEKKGVGKKRRSTSAKRGSKS
jgi:tetratricopeptide (TPR) repeat protein